MEKDIIVSTNGIYTGYNKNTAKIFAAALAKKVNDGFDKVFDTFLNPKNSSKNNIKNGTYKVTKKYYIIMTFSDGYYLVVAEDFGGTSSFGKTKKEALKNIKEACELYCDDMDVLPYASVVKDLRKFKIFILGEKAVLMDIKISKRYPKQVRKYLLKKCNRKGTKWKRTIMK